MPEALDLSLFAKPAGDGTLGMDVAVEGIACGGCIARIEGAMKRLPGVTEARLNFTNRRLHVAWSDEVFKPAQILQTLESIGYRGHPFLPLRAEQEEAAEARRLLRCLAVAGFAAMNVMLLSVSVWSGNVTDITPETRDFFHWASALIALPAAAYAGRPFFASAWQALSARSLNMNVPISLGVILALGMSVVETANHAEHAYYDSAIMLLFFLLVGRTLDQAMRRKVAAGATIYAGSMNYFGTLTLKVTAVGGTALIDEIERLLEKAASAKSRAMRLADRAARVYAPLVHATAALTLVGWLLAGASVHDAIVTAIAVLIITCPCALALAIPAVQVVASGALFRSGVILNSGDAIEGLAEADTVIFDKTGTLTLPEPRVINAAAIDSGLLQKASCLALSSRHPLAVALAREAALRSPFDGAVEEPGQGVRAMIDGVEARLGGAEFCGLMEMPAPAPGTSSIVFCHGGRSTMIAISQRLRSDAVEVVRSLASLGLDLHILSGDRNDAVAPIAQALGIANWGGELKPADKIALIEDMKAQGRRILMVGDGLNDAPALAAAHVSLSPIAAADVTQAQADAVFLGERLRPVIDAIAIARRAL